MQNRCLKSGTAWCWWKNVLVCSYFLVIGHMRELNLLQEALSSSTLYKQIYRNKQYIENAWLEFGWVLVPIHRMQQQIKFSHVTYKKIWTYQNIFPSTSSRTGFQTFVLHYCTLMLFFALLCLHCFALLLAVTTSARVKGWSALPYTYMPKLIFNVCFLSLSTRNVYCQPDGSIGIEWAVCFPHTHT